MTATACIVWLIASAPSVAVATDGEADVARAAFVAAHFTRVDHLRDVPVGIRNVLEQLLAMPEAERQLLEERTGRSLGRLGGERVADVDEEWNPSCVQVDDTPGAHFLFGGRSPRLWFVFFEQGGFAVMRTLITIRELSDGTYALEGRWRVDRTPADVASLQQDVSKLDGAERIR